MEMIQQLDYHKWAETELFQKLNEITEKLWTNLDPDLNKSLQSVYGHKVEVMWFWFQLIKQVEPRDPPKFEQMQKNELFRRMFQLFDDLQQFLAHNMDKNLELTLPWLKNPTYPITTHELLFNIFNHHTYHRGQIVILMKKLGIIPPETDYNPFMFAKLKLV
ncbi:MAG: DinB family protein [Candidatus Hodarchaeales archaeon]|jgi:uncharacterized damage-inducible protein DinB